MPTTTRQLAKIAGISESTVRNYTRDYSELLSPAGRGDVGSRLFSDEDVQVLCTIAALRKEEVPRAEIIERLTRGDIYIDPTPSPQQATPKPHEGQEGALVVHTALTAMQAQIDAIQRAQERLQRHYLWWGVLLGAISATVAAGFVVWVLWLTRSG